MLTSQQLFDYALGQHQGGRVAEAEAIYRQLLARHPGEPELLHWIGVAAHHQGRLEEGRELIQAAIARKPGNVAYHNNLGLLLHDLGDYAGAIAAYEAALRLQPQTPEALYNLSLTRQRLGEYELAIEACRAALALRPAHAKAWLTLGASLIGLGRAEEGLAAYRTGLTYAPQDFGLWNNLGTALQDLGRLAEAEETFRTAMRMQPDSNLIVNNLGNLLLDLGRAEEAVDAFRRATSGPQPRAETHSNLVFSLHYVHGVTAAQIAAEAARWQQVHEEPLRREWRTHSNDRSPERRLRIGYVSPDLRRHVVGRTLLPVFEAHDRNAFELACYSGCGTGDEITARFRTGAHLWRDTMPLSDAALAEQIRADGIDVLVDLSLHTSHHRLLTFARKPAPVQVSWLGYPGTTGLTAIDYILTDPHLDPPGLNEGYYRERLWRLPDCWCCIPRLPSGVSLSPPPALTAGHVTFGSLNSLPKLNDNVLAAWARILQAVPRSRLLLRIKESAARERIAAFLVARGVAAERLEFIEYVPAIKLDANRDEQFLRRYERIDLALDPFPYNGMTTTGEALWMGVPVIALRGRLPVSRAGYSLLANAGLSELVADSVDEYVRLAVALAQDLPRLATLRGEIRARLVASPLLDVQGLTRNLEDAYRQMWRDWCTADNRADRA